MSKTVTTCSFCNKTKEEVNKLIASEASAICDECVSKCGLILQGDEVKKDEDNIGEIDPHEIKQFLDTNVIGQDTAKEQKPNSRSTRGEEGLEKK